MKPEVFFISYATPQFREVLVDLQHSLQAFGINNQKIFRPENIAETPFFAINKELLMHPKGAGYWLWKPYIILETLRQMPENAILLYADAACRFISSPTPLINLVSNNEQGVMAFHLQPLKAAQWCKRDAFILTGCDSEPYWESDKVMGGILLFRKCDSAMRFVEEWLSWCVLPGALTDGPSRLGNDLPGFTAHRHDQALLGLLLKKHGILPYRNPSIWGNHLKLPKYRVKGEHLFYPFRLQADLNAYATQPDTRSPYGTLVELNRKGFYYRQPDGRRFSGVRNKLAVIKKRIFGRR